LCSSTLRFSRFSQRLHFAADWSKQNIYRSALFIGCRPVCFELKVIWQAGSLSHLTNSTAICWTHPRPKNVLRLCQSFNLGLADALDANVSRLSIALYRERVELVTMVGLRCQRKFADEILNRRWLAGQRSHPVPFLTVPCLTASFLTASYLSTIASFLLVGIAPSGEQEAVARQPVDLIELNHFVDDEGREVFRQIIFYDWSHEHRRFHVRAWRLIKRDSHLPLRRWNPQRYQCTWHDDGHRRQVWASKMRETWSQRDPERVNREMLPEDQRKPLFPPRVAAQGDQIVR